MLGFQPISDEPISSVANEGGGGGPTAYTLEGEAGSYTLSGQDATFTVSLAVDGDAGSYSIAGQDATFTVTTGPIAYTLEGEAGAYVISGQDATFNVSSDVAPVEQRRRAGGVARKRRYLIHGKFHWLTDDELSVLVAQEIADISRRDVRVAQPKTKPRVISAADWSAIMPLARLEAIDLQAHDEDEDELILAMI